jgi:soluble lytic murein transglycosylase
LDILPEGVLKKKVMLNAVVITVMGIFVGQEWQMCRQAASLEMAFDTKIAELNAWVAMDSTRQANMHKVLSIIDRYNQNLTSEIKHKIASEIVEACMKYENLDVDLICATITHESAFTWDPTITSPAGAHGLMQIMPETGKFLARVAGLKWTSAEDILFDPVINVRLGCQYLSHLIELYEVDGGLAAYNGGGQKAALWLSKGKAGGVLYQETQNYVPAVLALYNEFRN